MPVSSISGMNFAGGTTPKSALFQRSKASRPTILRVEVSTLGW